MLFAYERFKLLALNYRRLRLVPRRIVCFPTDGVRKVLLPIAHIHLLFCSKFSKHIIVGWAQMSVQESTKDARKYNKPIFSTDLLNLFTFKYLLLAHRISIIRSMHEHRNCIDLYRQIECNE